MVQWDGKMHQLLRSNLDIAKKAITDDWDMVFVVDGYEGTGKSCLAQQMAKYVDPTFCIGRVCFNPTDFVRSINSARKYQAVIYDEAYTGLTSRGAMSEVNKSLVAVLAEIRQKNLFVFIVMPCFFELDRYAAIWRSRALVHVYTGKNFTRGFFSFYCAMKKKLLYVVGKKFYSYKVPNPDFHGRFKGGYVVDEDDYRKRKLDALMQKEMQTVKVHASDDIRDKIIWEKHLLTPNKTAKMIAKDMEEEYNYTITPSSVFEIISDYAKKKSKELEAKLKGRQTKTEEMLIKLEQQPKQTSKIETSKAEINLNNVKEYSTIYETPEPKFVPDKIPDKVPESIQQKDVPAKQEAIKNNVNDVFAPRNIATSFSSITRETMQEENKSSELPIIIYRPTITKAKPENDDVIE